MHQLLIIRVVDARVERYYWDAVVKLVAKAVDGVVDYYNILKVTVGEYSQVFYVDTFWRSDALVSI